MVALDVVGGADANSRVSPEEMAILKNMRLMAPEARRMLTLLSDDYVRLFPDDRHRGLRIVVGSGD